MNRLTALFIASLLSFPLAAQTIYFNNLGIEDGLRSGNVRCFVKDREKRFRKTERAGSVPHDIVQRALGLSSREDRHHVRMLQLGAKAAERIAPSLLRSATRQLQVVRNMRSIDETRRDATGPPRRFVESLWITANTPPSTRCR